MSRSFLKLLKPFSNIFNSVTDSLDPKVNNFISITFGTISAITIIGHSAYAFGTVENKTIIVKKKYKFNRNGFTEFMVIDENDKHYNVNNSVWHWKWDSIEDWNKLEPNKEFIIKYYGWRYPLFGIFPNIVMSTNNKNK